MHLGPQGDAQKTWRDNNAKKKKIHQSGDAGVMVAFVPSFPPFRVTQASLRLHCITQCFPASVTSVKVQTLAL